jgi:hypothetical protein
MYKILRAETAQELEEKVNEATKDGFIPQGGLVFTNVCYYQAVAKKYAKGLFKKT